MYLFPQPSLCDHTVPIFSEFAIFICDFCLHGTKISHNKTLQNLRKNSELQTAVINHTLLYNLLYIYVFKIYPIYVYSEFDSGMGQRSLYKMATNMCKMDQ